MASLASCLIEDDRTSGGNIEGRNSTGHGDAQEMVAGSAGEIVQALAFAAQDNDSAGAPVIGVVIDGATLVEADAPDVLLLELLKCAD